MAGFCSFCQEDVTETDALAHAALHGWVPDRWPDGGLVRIEDLEPADFLRFEHERLVEAAMERPWWRHALDAFWAFCRAVLTRNQ